MGFFSDLKEDLTQAVNELLPEEEGLDVQSAQPAEEPAKAPETPVEALSLEEMLANIDSVQLPVDGEEAMGQETEDAEPEMTGDAEPEVTEPDGSDAASGGEAEPMPEPEMPEPAEPEPEPVMPEQAEEPKETEESAAEPEPEEPLSSETIEETAEPIVQDTDFNEFDKGAEKMETNAEAEQDIMVTDETAIITEGMQITGDMTSTGSLDVIGTVTGNIDILGKLNITGYITGNSKASEVYAEGAKINGEIVSEGAVKIGEESVIIGNITATYAVIAGAVKGDIDVHGPVLLDSTAIVMGNIRSKSVQINNGAVIEGMCSQCYADVSPTHFFDDYQPKTGKSKSKNN